MFNSSQISVTMYLNIYARFLTKSYYAQRQFIVIVLICACFYSLYRYTVNYEFYIKQKNIFFI